MFITEKDNFLVNIENIKLGSITEKLSGSKNWESARGFSPSNWSGGGMVDA